MMLLWPWRRKRLNGLSPEAQREVARRSRSTQAEMMEKILADGSASLHAMSNVAYGYGAAVQRLERDGLLELSAQHLNPGRGDCTYEYRLTPAGRVAAAMLVEN